MTPGLVPDKNPNGATVNATSDPINPAHYQGAVQCIEAIESLGIGEAYCQANAIKYLWRLGKKGEALEDAKKAQWYINRLVKQLEEGRKKL